MYFEHINSNWSPDLKLVLRRLVDGLDNSQLLALVGNDGAGTASFGRVVRANRRAAPPADAPFYVRRADNCQQLARNPKTLWVISDRRHLGSVRRVGTKNPRTPKCGERTVFNSDGSYKGTRCRQLRPGELEQMTATIVQIRDYQSKRAIERAHKELEKEAADGEGLGLTPEQIRACVEAEKAFPGNVYCGNPAVQYGGKGIDGMNLPDPA